MLLPDGRRAVYQCCCCDMWLSAFRRNMCCMSSVINKSGISLHWDGFMVFGWSVWKLTGLDLIRTRNRRGRYIKLTGVFIFCALHRVLIGRLQWAGCYDRECNRHDRKKNGCRNFEVNGLLWRNGRTSEDSIKVDFWGITNGYVKSIRLSQKNPKDGISWTRFGFQKRGLNCLISLDLWTLLVDLHRVETSNTSTLCYENVGLPVHVKGIIFVVWDFDI